MKYFVIVMIAICPALLFYGIFNNDSRSIIAGYVDNVTYFAATTYDLCDRVDGLNGINATVPGGLEIFYQSNCNVESELGPMAVDY